MDAIRLLFFEKFANQSASNFLRLLIKIFQSIVQSGIEKKSQKLIADLKQFIKDKSVSFDEKKFDQEMTKELTETPRKDGRQAEEIDLDGTKVLKVKGKNIFGP